MKEHGISQLPVLDGGRLVGIVTESRPARRAWSRAARRSTSTVAEVMFRNVHDRAARPTTPRILTELFAKGLVGLVVDDEQRLAGI